jgi:uncharacterized protein YndB with AHSA1/START domain
MSESTAVLATLVFERMIPATADQVFTAYADLEERRKWGAPSDNTALIYDRADFAKAERMSFAAAPKRTLVSTERPATWIF